MKDSPGAQNQSLATKWILLFALASAAVFLLLMNMEVGSYDEALMLQGAVQVGLGQAPHRDFFWPYGPMQAWIVSALFSAFGNELIVARAYDAAVRAGIILLCGLTARRLGLRPSLIIGILLIETALIAVSRFHLYPVFPSLLCALAGTLFLVADRPNSSLADPRLIAAGMLTGLTALFRYDIGFLLLVAHLAGLSLFNPGGWRSLRPLMMQILVYGVAVSLVFLPVAGLAWAAGAVPGFVHDIVSFPPANYARMRGLPWPTPSLSVASILSLIVYVPFLTAAVGLAWLARGVIRSDKSKSDVPTKLATILLLLTALFAMKGVVRVSMIHSVLALVPAIIDLVFLVSRTEIQSLRTSSLAVLAAGLLLISLHALAFMKSEASARFDNLLPAQIAGEPPAAMRDAGCAPPPNLGPGVIDGDTYRALCYIAAHTRPGDHIFVGAGRHDKVFINNVALYYLSGRRPFSRWYHLEPGLQTQATVQTEMIEDLVRNDVRLVALDTRWDQMAEPNDSANSSGVCLLDRFIQHHYREVARFGSIVMLARQDAYRGRPTPPAAISCNS
jgi:hypothetical protein